MHEVGHGQSEELAEALSEGPVFEIELAAQGGELVSYDERGTKFLNEGGRIQDRLYAVGWARRGPTGTIGTNRPDGYAVAESIAAAMPSGSSGGKPGSGGL